MSVGWATAPWGTVRVTPGAPGTARRPPEGVTVDQAVKEFLMQLLGWPEDRMEDVPDPEPEPGGGGVVVGGGGGGSGVEVMAWNGAANPPTGFTQRSKVLPACGLQ